ncbi:MAG TPA: GNAT family N-acetyltransferase [Blastocatellia bacterium]|nr:GNAT family N-acetyltransferase [Blastocatellia bacterium]
MIERMQSTDWQQVRSIYVEGIATGDATFETDAPDWQTFNKSHFPFGRLVARQGDSVLGWAALSPVSNRCVYGGVAEISVYVASAARGKGAGRALVMKVIEDSERNGIWTLQAGIMAENAPSIALHRRCGFREVGRRERIGRLKGVWRDVIVLERRSQTVGLD